MQPIALTIAGSDSGGGAGIQADLKTFHAFGVFGTSALTAVTAQDTRGVHAVQVVNPEIVRAQIAAVAGDLPPAACKTGMLATAEVVAAVAEAIAEHAIPNYVLDPVMIATSGDRLLDVEAETRITELLVPLATVVTPNLHEASLLVGREVRDVPDMKHAAETLVARGARAALVKGGHLEGDEVVDVLFDGNEHLVWSRPRLRSTNTHGTGCTLSAAVAAGLSLGRPLVEAVDTALSFVRRAIASAPPLGRGNGPLNFFVVPENERSERERPVAHARA